MAVEKFNSHDLQHIIEDFVFESRIREVEPFGSGHINDTYRLFSERRDAPDYLLQRINHSIFKNVDGMMNNIYLVTSHLQLHKQPECDQTTLHLIKTKEGALYTRDQRGNYWRAFDFKKNTRSYDVVETEEQAYQGARAFGLFFRQLVDFNTTQLVDTIPDFHNIIVRLELLKASIEKYNGERTKRVKEKIKWIFDHADQMCEIENKKISGTIPIRVTHNDTKFNNVLLDQNDKGVCVIDLDTVMPGVVHYDFGDGIRTSTNAAAEDEEELSKVFDFEKYKAFSIGYLEATREVLVTREIELLGFSGALLTYLMGVRFLTDYISHDIYYKTKYPEHNLVRAKGQLELARQMLDRLDDLDKFVLKEAGIEH